VPVLASVAAILRAMWPDLPTPETMTRPRQARISSMALRKAPSRRAIRPVTACASMRKTFLASSSALGSTFAMAGVWFMNVI